MEFRLEVAANDLYPDAMFIRFETPDDYAAIFALTQAAFRDVEHSSQTEAQIVNALRAAGALRLSLVAQGNQGVIGHIAFSRVLIDGADLGWFGLGPVSVLPACQGQGVGRALIEEGLAQLRSLGAGGCVLLGDPEYYRRFGFQADAALTLEGVPPEYFMACRFNDDRVQGAVSYHSGFDAR